MDEGRYRQQTVCVSKSAPQLRLKNSSTLNTEDDKPSSELKYSISGWLQRAYSECRDSSQPAAGSSPAIDRIACLVGRSCGCVNVKSGPSRVLSWKAWHRVVFQRKSETLWGLAYLQPFSCSKAKTPMWTKHGCLQKYTNKRENHCERNI